VHKKFVDTEAREAERNADSEYLHSPPQGPIEYPRDKGGHSWPFVDVYEVSGTPAQSPMTFFYSRAMPANHQCSQLQEKKRTGFWCGDRVAWIVARDLRLGIAVMTKVRSFSESHLARILVSF
jgi:hypothetical protein